MTPTTEYVLMIAGGLVGLFCLVGLIIRGLTVQRTTYGVTRRCPNCYETVAFTVPIGLSAYTADLRQPCPNCGCEVRSSALL